MNTSTADREIKVTRLLSAPPELVWRAMTDPTQVVRWWGPRGFTTTVQQMDLVVGGHWRHVMHGPDGTDYANHSVFTVIEPPHRLCFRHGGNSENGLEVQFDATWSFTPQAFGTKTEVTIHMIFPTKAQRDLVVEQYGALEGAQQTLERLGEHLLEVAPRSRELTLERHINAAPAAVLAAWTDATQLVRWWGPAGFTNPVCETNPQLGGAWRVVMQAPDGAQYPCQGVYQEITPQRLVFTNIATDAAGNPILDGLTIVSFDAVPGGTNLKVQTRATALIPEATAHLAGMQVGWQQSLERLAAL